MNKPKVTVSVDDVWLGVLDGMVAKGAYASRSAAMEAAIEALYYAEQEAQLDRALAALTPEDVAQNQAEAEEGMADYAALVGREGW